MDEKRKKWVCAWAVLLFAGVLVYRILNPYTQDKVEKLTFTNAGTSKPLKVSSQKTPRDKNNGSDFLFADFFNKGVYSKKVIQDLFVLPGRDVEKVEKDMGEAVETQGEDPGLMPLPAESENPIDPLQEAVKYISSFKYLGSYESAGERAFFLSRNKLVLVARVGDRIDGKYLVEKIGEHSIRINALNINQTINLDIREFNDD